MRYDQNFRLLLDYFNAEPFQNLITWGALFYTMRPLAEIWKTSNF